jgi:hypothetical protein
VDDDAGSALKQLLVPLIIGLTYNTSLRVLNVSGQGGGDAVAFTLAQVRAALVNPIAL